MKEPTAMAAHSSHATSVPFSPDIRFPVSAGLDKPVRLWSVPPWELLRAFKGHGTGVNTLSFSAEGVVLASACDEGIFRLWSLESREAMAVLRDHPKNVSSATFAPGANGCHGRGRREGSHRGGGVEMVVGAELGP